MLKEKRVETGEEIVAREIYRAAEVAVDRAEAALEEAENIREEAWIAWDKAREAATLALKG